jgi:hypothetical protein
LVFSWLPRCQGVCGSAKQISGFNRLDSSA